ncbi:MAG: sigma-54-dependent Fis family transcriptional regulator [Gemmatimonadetes bacterium]|nr:sigma-54-dependent Fis family transcriptional regulator [Gemmatimonadota bacterium]
MTPPSSTPPAQILSRSPAIALLLKRVQQVANTDIQVLMLGETGVGKSLLAQTIHHQSTRDAEPFKAVNCGGLPPSLIESELFGHERGAFTGATKRRTGYFEQADGGTIFLDEIGDMSMEAQQRLLHVLEQDRLTRVGGTTSVPVDVRVIAATHRDLQQAIGEGTFREDLYYRLKGFLLTVPPLRARREDIPLLAEHFMRQYAHQYQRPVRTLSADVLTYLQGYAWPGNVRELKQWVRQAVVVCEGERMAMADVWAAADVGLVLPSSEEDEPPVCPRCGQHTRRRVAAEEAEAGPPLTAAEAEKPRIIAALQQTNWVVSGERGAAHLLGMSAKTLAYRMHKYGIQRPKSA